MAKELDKLVKEVRIELREALVADKEKAKARALACLLHAETLIENWLGNSS